MLSLLVAHTIKLALGIIYFEVDTNPSHHLEVTGAQKRFVYFKPWYLLLCLGESFWLQYIALLGSFFATLSYSDPTLKQGILLFDSMFLIFENFTGKTESGG